MNDAFRMVSLEVGIARPKRDWRRWPQIPCFRSCRDSQRAGASAALSVLEKSTSSMYSGLGVYCGTLQQGLLWKSS